MTGSARDRAIEVALGAVDSECDCEVVAATAIVDALAARPDVLRALAGTPAEVRNAPTSARPVPVINDLTHVELVECLSRIREYTGDYTNGGEIAAMPAWGLASTITRCIERHLSRTSIRDRGEGRG